MNICGDNVIILATNPVKKNPANEPHTTNVHAINILANHKYPLKNCTSNETKCNNPKSKKLLKKKGL